MPAISASAPGKIILVGEHAVVYGQPAIAIPVTGVKAKVVVLANPIGPAGQVWVEAPQVGINSPVELLPDEYPLRVILQEVTTTLGIPSLPAMRIKITSTIPKAAGMGSSAAVTVALVRAVSAFLGHPFDDRVVNQIAYNIEKLHHGTPSGIDNTVITYAQPVYFIRGEPIQFLQVSQPFTLLIADSGIESSTAETVSAVRRRWQSQPDHYEELFRLIGNISQKARIFLQNGPVDALGELLTGNHHLLQSLGVSLPALDRLVDAALAAGAQGAKLSGGGGGGNVIALVAGPDAPAVSQALLAAGARNTIMTTIHPVHTEGS